MIKVSDLTFSYSEKSELKFPDFSVDAGGHMLILGNSGVGKTTLLHLLAGILVPASGSVEIQGNKMEQMSAKQRDKFRGNNIGLVFQRSHFVQSLSVKENLQLVQFLSGNRQSNHRITEVLTSLELQDYANKKTYQLSIGQQQRLSVAVSVVNQPALILADEPTSSLDDENTNRVVSLLKSQSESVGATLMIIIHDHRLKSEFEKQLTL